MDKESGEDKLTLCTSPNHSPPSKFFIIEDRHLYDASTKFFYFYFGRLIYGRFGQNLKTYLIKVSILIALI